MRGHVYRIASVVIAATPWSMSTAFSQDVIFPKYIARPAGPHTCPGEIPYGTGAMVMTVVSLTVTKDGQSENVAVASTSGDATLDNAAILCVQKWKWIPVQEDGHPIEFGWGTYVRWAAPKP